MRLTRTGEKLTLRFPRPELIAQRDYFLILYFHFPLCLLSSPCFPFPLAGSSPTLARYRYRFHTQVLDNIETLKLYEYVWHHK